MAEAKKAAKTAAETFPHVTEFPTFGKFDMPRFEFPTAYREAAEKGIAQAKQNYERMKEATEEASDLIETIYTSAFKGSSEYGLKVIDAFRTNVNTQLDFARDLLAVKSPSEVVELSSAHARKTFDSFSAQSKELASLAQKVSNDTAEPIKAGINKALRVVA